jgi:hypothetical protein
MVFDITPAVGGVGQSQVAETRQLVEFLATLPELRQTGPVAFEGAPGQPWVSVILAKRGSTGGYHTDGSFIPKIDIVELVCSSSEDSSWYDGLASRIAAFLGWNAYEEHENRLVWQSS